jgi:hypothetical protein
MVVFRALEQEGYMKPKFALVGLLALGTVGVAPQSASAMPNGLPHANQLSNVEQVRWVCSPWGRCWWRPNYYRSFGFYPLPRFGHRPWGWHHRGWRHRW